MSIFWNIIGYVSAVLLLGAYLGVTTGKLKPTSLGYQGLNFVGTFLLIVYSLTKNAYASVLLNAVWIMVAVLGLWRWAQSRRAKTAAKPVQTETDLV